MKQQTQNKSEFHIEKGISYNQVITAFAVLLYRSPFADLAHLIDKEVRPVDGVALTQSANAFWLVKSCEKQSEQELDQIQRMVGLGQTIICYELPNSLEMLVEKLFGKTQNQIYSSRRTGQLIFVKESYKQKQSGSDIKYFESIDKVHAWLKKSERLSINPIKVLQLLQLYDCENAQNIAKVKAIHETYLSLHKRSENISMAQRLVFDSSKSLAIVKSQILQMKMPSQIEDKLIWKLQQMHRYRTWIEEEQQTPFIEYSRLTFEDLSDKLGFAAVVKYRDVWTGNSLRRLKGLFRQIGSKSDNIAIKEFQRQYKLMKNSLEVIRQSLGPVPQGSLFAQMSEELQNFYEYQNNIIEGTTLSSLHYLLEEAIYLWKYENNFYKKMAVFFLLGALASSQRDYIWGLTLLILAVITLTLRC